MARALALFAACRPPPPTRPGDRCREARRSVSAALFPGARIRHVARSGVCCCRERPWPRTDPMARHAEGGSPPASGRARCGGGGSGRGARRPRLHVPVSASVPGVACGPAQLSGLS